MESLFDRNQTAKLTKLTLNQLSYLRKKGIVEPAKLEGNGNRPKAFYSYRQVVELRCIYELRVITSLQKLQQAKAYFTSLGIDNSLYDKILLVSQDSIHWIDSLEDVSKIIQITANNTGQLAISIDVILSIAEVCLNLKKEAYTANIDFDSAIAA